MIRLPDVELPEETQVDLDGFQEAVDEKATYAEKVAEAKLSKAMRKFEKRWGDKL